MSFPVLFSSQLAAIMDALLKAVVLEVTALVEDGAAELRLELRERDREIRNKDLEIDENHREIEENHREIQELRAALELLKAREEAAFSPVRSGGVQKQEQTESCAWTNVSEVDTPQRSVESPDMRPTVKSEQAEDFTTTSSTIEPRLDSLSLPPVTTLSDQNSFKEEELYIQSYQSYDNVYLTSTNEETDDSSHWEQEQFEQQTLPSDPAPLQHISEDHFNLDNPQHAGLSLLTPFVHVQDSVRINKNIKRTRRFNTKRLNHIESGSNAGFRCDQCGKCFKHKQRLVTHQSVHTGAKLFSCRKCGKRFSRRDNCVRHERSDKHCGKEVAKMFKS